MKHLKLRGKFIPATGKVQVTTLQMTHFDYDFGNTCTFIASNGVRLKSDDSVYEEDQTTRVYGICNRFIDPRNFGGIFSFYLPINTDEMKEWVCFVTLEEWEHIKKAITEYNTKFA